MPLQIVAWQIPLSMRTLYATRYQTSQGYLESQLHPVVESFQLLIHEQSVRDHEMQVFVNIFGSASRSPKVRRLGEGVHFCSSGI